MKYVWLIETREENHDTGTRGRFRKAWGLVDWSNCPQVLPHFPAKAEALKYAGDSGWRIQPSPEMVTGGWRIRSGQFEVVRPRLSECRRAWIELTHECPLLEFL